MPFSDPKDPSADRDALERYAKSRNAAACGFSFSLLALVAGGMLYGKQPGTTVICAVSGAVHLAAALVALRSRQYAVPGVAIGLNILFGVALTNLFSQEGPQAAFTSVTLLFLALVPQLTMHFVGTGGGAVTAAATLAYLSAVFGWLVLHPERASEPLRDVARNYAVGVAGISSSFVLSLLYRRVRARMVVELQGAHAALDARGLAEQGRLKGELDLAARIQAALLPRDLRVEGLEIATCMVPAAEVGGDYYDVIPVDGGAWLCIGDVAGHGLNAGLAMLMMQSAVSALAQRNATRSPEGALSALNTTLYQNIRRRLERDEHATLTLLRYHRDGSVLFAGAHEDILVLRAAEGRCETISTPGPWMGAQRDVKRFAVMSRLALREGDVLVLYTDGLTEAMDADRRQFGLLRVEAELLRVAGESVETIRDALLGAVRAFTPTLTDDVTILVARYHALHVA